MNKPILYMLTGGIIAYLLVDEKNMKKTKKMFCDIKHKFMN